MELLEIRPDFERDPAGDALADFLTAQRAYERATLRRVFLVHVTVLAGLLVWLAALGYFPLFARKLALLGFGTCFAGVILAAGLECRWHGAARSAEKRLTVRRIGI